MARLSDSERRPGCVLFLLTASTLFATTCARGAGPADATRVQRSEAPREGRVIAFPADHSLGELFIRNAGAEGSAGWTKLGEAQGIVEIPPRKETQLNISDDTYPHFPCLAQLEPNDLQEIGVYSQDLSDADLGRLAGLTGLQRLGLMGPVSSAGLGHLRPLKSLTELWLARTEIDDEGLAHLAGLAGLETIRSWENRRVSGAGFRHLTGAQCLRTLDFYQTPVNDEGAAWISQIPSLKELSLQYTEVTDIGLARLTGLPQLRDLVLPPKASDEGLAHLKQLQSLESLNIMHTRITDSGLRHLQDMKQLKSLVIHSTLMTGEGLIHLRGMASLEDATLTLKMITRTGLARMEGLPVTNLNLSGSAMGDEELKLLRDLPRLQSLSLQGTRITGTGLSHLKGLRSLRELRLRNTEVSAAAVQTIREALPECQVTGPGRRRQKPNDANLNPARSMIGRPAPELAFAGLLQGPANIEITWERLEGNVVVLEFWATSCGPCVRAFPHINALVERFKDRPVQFISITRDQEPIVADFLKRYLLRGWIALDKDKAMFESYQVGGIPHTVVVDRSGTVVQVTRPMSLTEESLEELLEEEGK